MDERLSQVIGTLYEAALDAAPWRTVVEQASSLLGSGQSHIFLHDLGQRRASDLAITGFDETSTALFNERFFDFAPCMAATAVSDVACVTLGELRRTELYNELFKPIDCHHALVTRVLEGDRQLWFFCVARAQSKAPFSTTDRELAHIILPHLRRALRIHERLRGSLLEAETGKTTLDRVPHGVFVLDRSARVVLSNAAARQLLDAADGLERASGGQLRAARFKDTKQLWAAVERVVDGETPAGVTLRLERPSGKRGLVVQVIPAAPEVGPLGLRTKAAVLFVTDPEARDRGVAERLADLYGLTRAEARVGAELLAGKSPQEVAECLSVSLPTVRTHLRRLYERTDTRGQSEFIAVVLRSVMAASPSV